MTAPTLVTFLRERIAEQQVAAERANQMPWLIAHGEDCDWPGDMPGYCSCDAVAHALAECAAKLRIVKRCEYPGFRGEPGTSPALRETADLAPRYDLALDVLRSLALPYANHPDCRSEWLP